MREELTFEENFNPPATPQEINSAESELAVKFPQEIRSIYTEYNGIPEYTCEHLPFHLMPLSEVVTLNRIFRNETHSSELVKKYGLICLWGDDQSNYAGIYLDGPFKGKTCFVDHEAYYVGDVSPLFRNEQSFTNRVIELAKRNRLVSQFEEGALKESELKTAVRKFPYSYYEYRSDASWHAMPVDYPARQNSLFDQEDRESFERISLALNQRDFSIEGERKFLIYALARLTPYAAANTLLPLLEENDMYIPSHVCNTLWLRRYAAAIPYIATLALNCHQNCRQSAERTLAKFIVDGVPGAQDLAEARYKELDGDSSSLKETVKRIQASPALMYQW